MWLCYVTILFFVFVLVSHNYWWLHTLHLFSLPISLFLYSPIPHPFPFSFSPTPLWARVNCTCSPGVKTCTKANSPMPGTRWRLRSCEKSNIKAVPRIEPLVCSNNVQSSSIRCFAPSHHCAYSGAPCMLYNSFLPTSSDQAFDLHTASLLPMTGEDGQLARGSKPQPPRYRRTCYLTTTSSSLPCPVNLL